MPRTPRLDCEPGWTGVFTREQAEGAIPNGTRIVKVRVEPGDAHPLGAEGVVLGSFSAAPVAKYFYFVEWADTPRVAVGVRDAKIREVK